MSKNRTSRVGGRGMQACNELCTGKERARTRTVRDEAGWGVGGGSTALVQGPAVASGSPAPAHSCPSHEKMTCLLRTAPRILVYSEIATGRDVIRRQKGTG